MYMYLNVWATLYILNTGNFDADFKLLTHNRYLVLNGHFVRQIHPSSFTLGLFLKKMSFEMVQNFMHINVHFCTEHEIYFNRVIITDVMNHVVPIKENKVECCHLFPLLWIEITAILRGVQRRFQKRNCLSRCLERKLVYVETMLKPNKMNSCVAFYFHNLHITPKTLNIYYRHKGFIWEKCTMVWYYFRL